MLAAAGLMAETARADILEIRGEGFVNGEITEKDGKVIVRTSLGEKVYDSKDVLMRIPESPAPPVKKPRSAVPSTGRSSSWLEEENGYREALERQSRSGRPYAIYFYTDWCGYCKDFKKKVLGNSAVEAALAGVDKVRINTERSPAVARAFDVSRIPRFFVVSKDGSLQRLSTSVKPADFIEQCRRAGLLD